MVKSELLQEIKKEAEQSGSIENKNGYVVWRSANYRVIQIYDYKIARKYIREEKDGANAFGQTVIAIN